MHNKQILVNNFETSFVKKYQTTKIFQVNFLWEYTTLFELCSKPKLLAYIRKKYQKDFTKLTVDFVSDFIDQIRQFIKEVDQAFWAYLHELNQGQTIINMYEEFLRLIYAESKKIVNDYLIEMIICFNENSTYMDRENNYQVEPFSKYLFLKFKNNFQNFVYKRLKLINKKYSTSQVIAIVLPAYEEDLLANEAKLKKLKTQAKL